MELFKPTYTIFFKAFHPLLQSKRRHHSTNVRRNDNEKNLYFQGANHVLVVISDDTLKSKMPNAVF